jgi:high-affinity nickel-transport protein
MDDISPAIPDPSSSPTSRITPLKTPLIETFPEVENDNHDTLVISEPLLDSKFSKWAPRIQRVFSKVPKPALTSILLLILVNIIVWIVIAIVLRYHPSLSGNALLAYTLGLRHALDADHIAAIDLMTRRLVADGQRPSFVGLFFSLGHSTVVIITTIVTAATAAEISTKFDKFSYIGNIVGSAVSTAFLLLLGAVNAWILWKLVGRMKLAITYSNRLFDPNAPKECESHKAKDLLNFNMDSSTTGGGIMFRVFRGLFKLIDRPWKMYPLGFMFGLGFDTSSEIALLGISSVQASKGTSIWLILIFPVLFTAGMALLDTVDGALMMALYVGAASDLLPSNGTINQDSGVGKTELRDQKVDGIEQKRASGVLAVLYYSIVLTSITVLVSIVIGVIQALNLVEGIANYSGPFWDGLANLGNNWDIVGGAVCGSFAVFGLLAAALYGPWKQKYIPIAGTAHRGENPAS